MAVRARSTERALGPDRAALINFLLDNLVWLILAVILAIFSLTIEHFFQLGIFLNILQHATFVGLIAIGLSFCIIAGHMDLSVESVMAFAAMLATYIMIRGLGLVLTGGRSMYGLPDDFRAVATTDVFGLPLLVLILLLAYVVFHVVLTR